MTIITSVFIIVLALFVLFYEDDKIELKLMRDIKTNRSSTRRYAAQSTYATEEILDIALDDEDINVKLAAIINPNITTKLIIKALQSENRTASLIASKHPKCPEDLRLIYILSN
jgi:DNA-directed RNA polymerase subunit F